MDTETQKQIRAELQAFIDERLQRMREVIEEDLTLPVVVDFLLVAAVEDGADPDSDTYYLMSTSGCSHYRKVGLATCARAMLLRDDPEE